MKKILSICICFLIFSCSKDHVLSTANGGKDKGALAEEKQKMLGGGTNGGSGDCYRYFQDHPFDSNALRSLHECVWSSDEWTCLGCGGTPPEEPEHRPTICERFPFLCQAYWGQPTGQFPNLLKLLGLTNSSTRAEIGIAHDFLQKYNAIILAAVAANPDWINYNNIYRQTQILTYYKDVYMVTNAPLSTAEFNFFVAYTELLFYEGISRIGDIMIVRPEWAYMLFYNSTQPLYPDLNGSEYPIIPNMDWDNWDGTNGNNLLEIAGVPIGFLPLVPIQN